MVWARDCVSTVVWKYRNTGCFGFSMRIVRIVRSRVFKVTKLKQVQLSAAEPAFFKMLMGLSGQAEKLLFEDFRRTSSLL